MARRRSLPAVRRCTPITGQTCCSTAHSSWGEVEKDFAESPHRLSFRLEWGRSSTVPVETFAVLASWDPWREILDVFASVQMPRYPEQIARGARPARLNAVRVHNDVDVGGSYGVKRGIKHAVLAGYLARRLGFPVRLDRGPAGEYARRRCAWSGTHLRHRGRVRRRGIVKSMKMRALDNVGAYAGRSPFQLGKPIGAIVGPYRIESVQYRAIAVTTNKTVQEAVRGFGQSPTNYAIETGDGGGRRGIAHSIGWRCAGAISSASRGVSLSDPERDDI